MVVVLLAVSAPPTALAHQTTDNREDPEGDFAKKPRWKEDLLWPAFAGAPCPLTDILSVDATSAHEDHPELDWDATLVTLHLADLTVDPPMCPLFDEGDEPRLGYAFRVRSSSHDYTTVFWAFQGGLDDPLSPLVRWQDSGTGGFFCDACGVGLDRTKGTMTLALPTFAADPPYRHVNAYTASSLCVPPDPPSGIQDVAGCRGGVNAPETGSHADVVPNLGEGEWSLYTDEADGPVGRLIP